MAILYRHCDICGDAGEMAADCYCPVCEREYMECEGCFESCQVDRLDGDGKCPGCAEDSVTGVAVYLGDDGFSDAEFNPCGHGWGRRMVAGKIRCPECYCADVYTKRIGGIVYTCHDCGTVFSERFGGEAEAKFAAFKLEKERKSLAAVKEAEARLMSPAAAAAEDVEHRASSLPPPIAPPMMYFP